MQTRRFVGKWEQVAVKGPGVALWISLTAGALVLGLGAGTAWWFLAGRDLEHAASLQQSADDLVFTGDDLTYFLVGEKSLAAAGLPITLDALDSTFFYDAEMGTQFEPEQCGALHHDVTDAPAGARLISGSINEDGTDGYSQQVVQFATVDEAIDSFGTVIDSLESCGSYVAQAPGEEPQDVTVRELGDGGEIGPTVALGGSDGSEPSWGWVILRQSNVVVVAGYSNLVGAVTEAQARDLGLAVHERAAYATAKKRSSGE